MPLAGRPLLLLGKSSPATAVEADNLVRFFFTGHEEAGRISAAWSEGGPRTCCLGDAPCWRGNRLVLMDLNSQNDAAELRNQEESPSTTTLGGRRRRNKEHDGARADKTSQGAEGSAARQGKARQGRRMWGNDGGRSKWKEQRGREAAEGGKEGEGGTVGRAAIKLKDGGGHDDLASTGKRRKREK